MRKYDELFEMLDIAFVRGKSGYCGGEKGSLRDSRRVDRYVDKVGNFSGCHGGFPLPRDVRSGRGWTF